MKVTYREAKDAEPRVWVFDPEEVPQSQAEMIEKRYGRNWDAFLQDVRQGSAKARKVLLWHLLRRELHTLRYEDTPDFRMGAVVVEHTLDELLVLRDRVAKASGLEEEERQQVLAALDDDITAAEAETAGEATEGKATP